MILRTVWCYRNAGPTHAGGIRVELSTTTWLRGAEESKRGVVETAEVLGVPHTITASRPARAPPGADGAGG